MEEKITRIIDTATNTTSKIEALKNVGIETVIRYYCTNTENSKCLHPAEAEALSEAGIHIGVVFQDIQNAVNHFDKEKGYAAGKEAYNYAKNTMHQPFGSDITFAVDFNPSQEEINNYIIPYFEGVHQAFSELSKDQLGYGIGAYGSGLTCNTLWKEGLCSYRWLSNSSSYHGTKQAKENGNYELEQEYISHSNIDGIPVDYDILNPNPPGTFLIGSFPSPTESGIYKVNVSERSFLHLRAAPDVDSRTVAHLKNGQRVYVLDISDQWAYLKVKIHGELHHGFSFVEYLEKEE